MIHKTVKAVLTGSLMSATIVLAACGGSDSSPTAAAADVVEAPTNDTRLSANNATETELQTIPGVGENIAHEIVEYRPYDAATGPAKFRDEMSKYIDDEQIEVIIQYLDFQS